jgi:hypothetical protein
VLNSGAGITVTNCVVQNFAPGSGNGILLQPTSGGLSLIITNTLLSRNGNVGLYYGPPTGSTVVAFGVIDHVVATDNHIGIWIDGQESSGATTVAISDSVVSNNPGIGIDISFATEVSVDGSKMSGNGFGISAIGFSVVVYLGHSVITGNTNGVINQTSPNQFFTFSDNHIGGNKSDFLDEPLAQTPSN